MQRGLPNTRPWPGIFVLAMVSCLSCGSGLHAGEGEWYAQKTIDQNGGQIVLGEAVLDVWKGCLPGPTLITLRRFPSIAQTGAIGPVFELEIPAPQTFIANPRLSIATSPAIAVDPNSIIAKLVPAGKVQEWIPEDPRASCTSPWVCDDLQTSAFTTPPSSSQLASTNKLDYAIVKLCGDQSDCSLPHQSCQARACQYCPTCNQ